METAKTLTICFLAFGLLACSAQLASAEPMGTAFTYQGQLYDNNYPANGCYDFTFALYDANVGGNKLGTDINVADVNVIDGYSTIELDFGNVFDGNARWLGIGVRPGVLSDPNSYTTLSPRQEVTPTPYAGRAKTAQDANTLDGYGATAFAPSIHSHHSLDAADGSPTDAVYVDNEGNVGIGTTGPRYKLEIDAGASESVTDTLLLTNNNVPINSWLNGTKISMGYGYSGSNENYTSRIVSYTNPNQTLATKLQLQTHSATFGVFNEGVMIDNNGNVGIGATEPGAKLEVAGQIKITGGTPGANKVLTCDASGLASWQNLQAVPGGVPSGVIVMWSGSIATIPSGWALCDGTNGTPNLSNRFVLGVTANSAATVGNKGPDGSVSGIDSTIRGSGNDIYMETSDSGSNAKADGGGTCTAQHVRLNYFPPYYALAYIMKL